MYKLSWNGKKLVKKYYFARTVKFLTHSLARFYLSIKAQTHKWRHHTWILKMLPTLHRVFSVDCSWCKSSFKRKSLTKITWEDLKPRLDLTLRRKHRSVKTHKMEMEMEWLIVPFSNYVNWSDGLNSTIIQRDFKKSAWKKIRLLRHDSASWMFVVWRLCH